MPRRTKKQVEELAIEAANMHQEKLSPEDIAEELSISVPYLYKLLKEQGVELGKAGRRSAVDMLDEEDKQVIIANYQSREIPMSAVLGEYGLSYNQMYTLLRKEGVEIRRHIDGERESKILRLNTAVQMYEDGALLWLIEDETGIHQPELHRELHKRNVTLRRARKSFKPKTGVTRLDKVANDPVP